MHALRKLRLAEADVAEAAEWYESQRAGLGTEFISAVQEAGHQLCANPLRYPLAFASVRRARVGRFPYGLFFFMDGEVVVVLGVLHNKRDTWHILTRRRSLV